MDIRSTIDDRLPSLAWQATLAITILALIAFTIVGLRVRVDVSPNMVVMISGYVFLTVYYRFVRQSPEIACTLISFGQLLVVILMGIMLSYAASAVPLPYRDAEFHAIDRWLGFEREAYIAYLQRHDELRRILSFAYGTLMHQTVLVLVVAAVARNMGRLQTYVVAFAIAVAATAAVASFVPAANAMIYVDKVLTDLPISPDGVYNYFPTLEGLRGGTLRTINLGDLEGLISFPSFHTANAILFVWVLWPIRVLRAVLVPLNLLLVASTPLYGAHYAVDVLGGAAVAFGAIAATTWLMRRTEASRRCTAMRGFGAAP
jgi:membrane-associated phospholipid phosphatase